MKLQEIKAIYDDNTGQYVLPNNVVIDSNGTSVADINLNSSGGAIVYDKFQLSKVPIQYSNSGNDIGANFIYQDGDDIGSKASYGLNLIDLDLTDFRIPITAFRFNSADSNKQPSPVYNFDQIQWQYQASTGTINVNAHSLVFQITKTPSEVQMQPGYYKYTTQLDSTNRL